VSVFFTVKESSFKSSRDKAFRAITVVVTHESCRICLQFRNFALMQWLQGFQSSELIYKHNKCWVSLQMTYASTLVHICICGRPYAGIGHYCVIISGCYT